MLCEQEAAEGRKQTNSIGLKLPPKRKATAQERRNVQIQNSNSAILPALGLIFEL